MPQTTYTEAEVDAIIRVAWATGVRDVVVTMQGHTLDDEQVAKLERFIYDRKSLEATVKEVRRSAPAVSWNEMLKERQR